MFTERSEMEWKEEHDVFLCREILVSQPFKFKERTIERGKIWDEIANRLNNCQTLKFRVNKRSVRERFKLIKEKFKRKIQDEEKASGIDVEPASELEQALEDICALEESLPAEVMDSKQAKAEANKLKAEEIRQKAMESFGHTKAREGQDEPTPVPSLLTSCLQSVGRMFPHPQNQQECSWHCQGSRDDRLWQPLWTLRYLDG